MRTQDRKSKIENRKSGFTLLELLTVIIIIVMLMGLAALAFNTLTGRRSASMAQNQIAAMLGQMRAMAMNDSSVDPNLYGVLFFYDPNVERTVMQPVVLGNLGDPDPNDQYKGWVKDRNPSYQAGDRVIAITGVVTDPSDLNVRRPMPIRFRCKTTPSTLAATYPPEYVYFYPGPNYTIGNDYWEVDMDAPVLDISDMAAEQLPAGVGVQLLTDATTAPALWPNGPPERYLQTGMILFDKTGKVSHVWYQPCTGSSVQRRIQAVSVTPQVGFYTQFGLNIFDREKFIAATQTAAGTTFIASDQDYTFQVFGGARPAAADEMNEEQWLDENGKLLVLDRTSSELKEVRK